MPSPPYVCLMDDNKTTRHRVPCRVCEACARNQDWQRGFDAARQYVHTATETVAECEADLKALRDAAAALIAALPSCDAAYDTDGGICMNVATRKNWDFDRCDEHKVIGDTGDQFVADAQPTRLAAPLRALQALLAAKEET